MTALLEAHSISKHFPQKGRDHLAVLDAVSLTLRRGEILCILGASGCGKTTLLNILAGLETPSSGTVETDLARPGPQIGYMTQDTPLLPWRTVADNVALGMEFHRADPQTIRERTAHYLEQVRLSAFSGHWPHQLSGGMRQRVALARTLALHPALLLLDEPLGSLDISGRRRLSRIIKDYVKEKNAGAVVVTHSVEEAVFLADRIIILSDRPSSVAASFDAKTQPHAFETVLARFMEIIPENRTHV